MARPKVKGVQHVLTGVRDYQEARGFYGDILGVTEKFYDYGISWNACPDLYRASHHYAYAGYYGRKEGGILVECAQLTQPTPRPIHSKARYGDLGVNKITIEVSDVKQFCEKYKDKITFLCQPKSTEVPGWGDYAFIYGADRDGNLIEFISSSRIHVKETIGSIRSVGLSVTELDRSIDFYQRHCDFDTMEVKPHESFSGLVGEVSGSNNTLVRSCLLANSNGFNMLELYEVSKPRGRCVPFHCIMGDIGWQEMCFVTEDVLGVAKYCIEQEIEFACHPTPIDLKLEDGWKKKWFMHARDPDGILVEFIEL